MNEAINLSEADKAWEREIWNKAGEALAKKLTAETGIPHTPAEALQSHAESLNQLIDSYEADGTEEGLRAANILRGRRGV
jgi:hypothetical protein